MSEDDFYEYWEDLKDLLEEEDKEAPYFDVPLQM